MLPRAVDVRSWRAPRRPARATLCIGIAVFLFGVFMLILGRRPQGACVRK